MHAETHPSQSNYLNFFSGSNQGVTDDSHERSPAHDHAQPGRFAAGQWIHFQGLRGRPALGRLHRRQSGNYALKHCPWVNWQQYPVGNTSQPNSIPANLNVPFCTATDNINGYPSSYYFPTDYSQLPTVSFVIPNQYERNAQRQQHLCRRSKMATPGCKPIMDGYVQWARDHNSLLILTWDEDALDRSAQ